MLDALVPASSERTGAAFSTSDLLLLHGWCEFHGLSMDIDLAHRIDGIACDEVVALGAPDGSRQWALWRDLGGIMLQPQHAATSAFASVSDALQAVVPPSEDRLTDIRPTIW